MCRVHPRNIFEGVNGDSVYRGASFWRKLGHKIAGENVTVIDDGTIPGGFGTRPVRRRRHSDRRTVVIEKWRAEVLPTQHLHR